MARALLWLCLALSPAAALAGQDLTLSSPGLASGARMPLANVYAGCGGGNASPALRWSDAPAAARGFAVTMYDPDARGGFWHWIAYDIPSGTHGLDVGVGAPRAANAPRAMLQLRNDFGESGYSGPCPPPGNPHYYVITVYALDVPALAIAPGANGKEALAAIERHALAKAMLTFIWGR